MRSPLLAKLVLSLGLVLAAFAAPRAQALFRPCICPDIYAPVTCSNGVTYGNQCLADCAHATGCVSGVPS
jgi:hypothetical protein